MTAAEAAAELIDVDDAGLRTQARPWVVPLGPPAPGWVLPRSAQRPDEKDTPAT
jgi:hypothetical protein